MKRTVKLSMYSNLAFVLGLLLASCSGGATAPSDWKTFEGEGFSFKLPSTFEGGGGQQDFAAVAQMYRDAGNEALAQSVEANAGFVLLYAVDTATNNLNKTYTNVNVIREQNAALVD